MTEWYYVEDIEKFLDHIRKVSYEKFAEVNQMMKDDLASKFTEELDNILSRQESDNIVIPLLKKHKDTYKVSDKTVLTIIEKLNSRMISNSLNNLVKSGLIESAFDSELNDFVFWVKEDGNNSKTK
jgi:membrane-associated HD superfamily phosphohydrolase